MAQIQKNKASESKVKYTFT